VDDLRSTAIFIGGSDVAQGEALLEQVKQTFFGPLRVSVLLDANGANTTAAAAVLAAARHISLDSCRALVLAGTGAVGQRVARLLAGQESRVRLASRDAGRAAAACRAVAEHRANAELLEPCAVADTTQMDAALHGVQLVIAAGAAGVELLPLAQRQACSTLRVAIDLNAVPPAGIEGIGATDKARPVGDVICYGALGVGGTKMKIHKAAVRRLFEEPGLVLDAEEVYRIGESLDG
jgi:hypothetical protein